jgi:hypothetical protein
MTARKTTKGKFSKGDRVKLPPKDAGSKLYGGIRMPEDRRGTIAFRPREGHRVAVSWDDTRRPQYIDPDFWSLPEHQPGRSLIDTV